MTDIMTDSVGLARYPRRKVYYIAVFSSADDKRWFSPGRKRKVDQVVDYLRQIGFNVTGLNTGSCGTDPSAISIYNLCTYDFAPIRFIQLVSSAFMLGFTSISEGARTFLWLYNSRSAEAIVALVLLLVRPQLSLVLQLEDLPFARRANGGIAGLLDRFFTCLLSKRASHVFSVSKSVAESFSRMTGFASEKLCILPPALDPQLLQKASQRKDPFSDVYVSVMYAGSYSPEKGVNDLIDAFLTLPSGSPYRLFLAGPAPSSLALKHAADHNIIFCGMLPKNDLFDLYTSADVIVNPHRKILNPCHVFPFKLVETVASGALPFTTPVPGYELFGLPEECILRSPSDLLVKLRDCRSIWFDFRDRLKSASSACQAHYSAARVLIRVREELCQ